MKFKVLIHEEKNGELWAEVPAIPGCATEGENLEDLLRNVHEAIEACLSVEINQTNEPDEHTRIIEIAV